MFSLLSSKCDNAPEITVRITAINTIHANPFSLPTTNIAPLTSSIPPSAAVHHHPKYSPHEPHYDEGSQDIVVCSLAHVSIRSHIGNVIDVVVAVDFYYYFDYLERETMGNNFGQSFPFISMNIFYGTRERINHTWRWNAWHTNMLFFGFIQYFPQRPR